MLLQCSSESPTVGVETTNTLISGKVLYPSGESAAGATVKLRPTNYIASIDGSSDGYTSSQNLLTDELGNLSIRIINEGSFYIEVNDDSAYASRFKLSIENTTNDTTIADIVLKPYAVITGTIVKSAESAESLFVQIPGMDRITNIDDEGSFNFDDLPEGDYSLQVVSATNSDIILDEIEINVVADDTVDVISTSAWNYQSSVTINGTIIDETLYSFPLLIHLDSTNMDFTTAQNNGEDLRISKGNNIALPFEIDQWDATNKSAAIWVLVDTLHARQNSEFTLHWGNDKAQSLSNSVKTFGEAANYTGVWHLNDTGNVASAVDTSKLGTNYGAVPTEGVIGNAYNFINRGSATLQPDVFEEVSNEVTLSFWQYGIKLDSIARVTMILATDPDTTNENKILVHMPWADEDSLTYRVYWDAGDSSVVNRVSEEVVPSYFQDQWNYWSLTKNATTGDMKMFVNGELLNSSTGKHSSMSGLKNFKIGSSVYGNYSDRNYKGYVDELRVSKVERSDTWIKLSYENQKKGSTLLTVTPKN